MPENIEQEIKQMLSRMTGFEPEEINPDTDLIKDLNIDSLKVIEIATSIERTFNIRIKDSELTKLRTVKEAVNLLKDLLAKKAEK